MASARAENGVVPVCEAAQQVSDHVLGNIAALGNHQLTASLDIDGEPFVRLHSLYHSDLLLLCFEDWSLLDV